MLIFGMVWVIVNLPIALIVSIIKFPAILFTVWYWLFCSLPILHWSSILWDKGNALANLVVVRLYTVKFAIVHTIVYLLAFYSGCNQGLRNQETDTLEIHCYRGVPTILMVSTGGGVFSIWYILHLVLNFVAGLFAVSHHKSVSSNKNNFKL